mgnify:CR=1 FL=1
MQIIRTELTKPHCNCPLLIPLRQMRTVLILSILFITTNEFWIFIFEFPWIPLWGVRFVARVANGDVELYIYRNARAREKNVFPMFHAPTSPRMGWGWRKRHWLILILLIKHRFFSVNRILYQVIFLLLLSSRHSYHIYHMATRPNKVASLRNAFCTKLFFYCCLELSDLRFLYGNLWSEVFP